MKVQTWVPEKRQIARTLADVPSSREKPVLCWFPDGSAVSPMWVYCDRVWRKDRDGMQMMCGGGPSDFDLYDQPPQPKTLDEVPDLWIIQAEGLEDRALHLWAKEGPVWLVAIGCRGPFEPRPCRPSNHFKLTDHIAVLKETEIEVMG